MTDKRCAREDSFFPSFFFFSSQLSRATTSREVLEDMRMLAAADSRRSRLIGGRNSDAALARARAWTAGMARVLVAEEAATIVRRLREQRPEPDLRSRLRLRWDCKRTTPRSRPHRRLWRGRCRSVLVEPARREREDGGAVEGIASAARGIQPCEIGHDLKLSPASGVDSGISFGRPSG